MLSLKKKKYFLLLITLLLFGTTWFTIPRIHCQTNQPQDPHDLPFEGDVTFKIYPDESIKVKVVGGFEQDLETDFQLPPVYNLAFNLINSQIDKYLTDIKSSLLIKLNPMYSLQLSALDLNIMVNFEDLEASQRSNSTILFYLPGYLGVNGTMGTITEKATGTSTIEFDQTLKLGYTIYPKEHIQEFIQSLPMIKSQLASQLNEYTEGNVTLRELTLVSSEIGETIATLTFTGRIEGDLGKGIIALLTETYHPNSDLPESSQINLKELQYLWPKTGDLVLTFDQNEMTFKMDSRIQVEGDIDKQYNQLKNLYFKGLLQSSQTTQEMAQLINNFLIPTELSIMNLNIIFEYLIEGEKFDMSFTVDGLGFKPPTTEEFLTVLNEAFTGVSMPGLSLTLEGAADEEEFVEINVPESTSEPLLKDQRKAVWKVDNLANINHVSIEVREWPTLTSTVSQTEATTGETVDIDGMLSVEGQPLAEQKIQIVINNIVVETIETDSEGGFSYTHKFEDPGSYEVKAQFNYQEKTLESPITTENVKPSSQFTPMTTTFIIVGVIALVAIGYILLKKR